MTIGNGPALFGTHGWIRHWDL